MIDFLGTAVHSLFLVKAREESFDLEPARRTQPVAQTRKSHTNETTIDLSFLGGRGLDSLGPVLPRPAGPKASEPRAAQVIYD